MLRSFLLWLSLVATTVLVAACCGSVSCDCEDTYADAIALQFSNENSQDTTRGFYPAYIDTLFLVRIPRDKDQLPAADTVQITRPDSVVFKRPIIINNASPFALATGRKLDAYRYKLYLAPRRRRVTPTYTFLIDSVRLATAYEADGCCTCYRNSNKQVFTTDNKGRRQQYDLTDPARNNQLVPIVLKRNK